MKTQQRQLPITTSAVALAALCAIAGCGNSSSGTPTGDAGQINPDAGTGVLAVGADLLVDTSWLNSRVDDPNTQVIDVRGSAEFETAHIPGALSLSQSDLRAMVDGVNGQVASADTVQSVLRAAGVRNGTTIVVHSGGIDTSAARVVWTLGYHRHGDVRLLDGGFDAWQRAALSVETGPPSATRSEYEIVGLDDALIADADWILSRLPGQPNADPDLVLIDARSPGEYDAGHIPTARSVEWTNNLISGAMRPVGQVSALYPDVETTDSFVAYCASGSRASVGWFVMRWLGYEDVRLYDGSWNEWGSRPDLPVEN